MIGVSVTVIQKLRHIHLELDTDSKLCQLLVGLLSSGKESACHHTMHIMFQPHSTEESSWLWKGCLTEARLKSGQERCAQPMVNKFLSTWKLQEEQQLAELFEK